MIKTSAIIVIGASSSIGQAVIEERRKAGHFIIAVTRNINVLKQRIKSQGITFIESSYEEQDIAQIANTVTSQYQVEQLIICNGLLHNDDLFPEKRIEEIVTSKFVTVLKANVLTPIIWLKHLVPNLEKQTCKITILSARVGSISDNKLGGWYSYRTSKAALNMMVKTMAIECSRRAPNLLFILFHPGTTDSALSKPFQKNVPKGKLFTPEFVAKQLIQHVDSLPSTPNLHFIDWAGKAIDW